MIKLATTKTLVFCIMTSIDSCRDAMTLTYVPVFVCVLTHVG